MKLNIIYDYEDISNTKYEDMIKQNEDDIKKCVELCLNEEKINTNNTIEIYIRYTNNEYIKEINKEYRNIDKATDVLSFPMYEKEDLSDLVDEQIELKTLGDIIISAEKIEQQAIEYGHAFKRELIYLTTHAMFHLLGYDHIEEEDKKIMRPKEDKIMNILDISR